MRAQELTESSGYTLAGSYTPDLVFSKLWLTRELERVLNTQGIDSVPVAYILGSWYSNLSTILRKSNTPIKHIVALPTCTSPAALLGELDALVAMQKVNPKKEKINKRT
jgi:type III secretory pathway component EscU